MFAHTTVLRTVAVVTSFAVALILTGCGSKPETITLDPITLPACQKFVSMQITGGLGIKVGKVIITRPIRAGESAETYQVSILIVDGNNGVGIISEQACTK